MDVLGGFPRVGFLLILLAFFSRTKTVSGTKKIITLEEEITKF